MQRYFVDIDSNSEFVFSKQDIFHISKVMRMKINDQVEVVNNNKVYLVNIDSFSPFKVHIIKENPSESELPVEVRIFLPLLKSDKAELIIQKATELGVTSIIFYLSKRSIIHLNNEDFVRKITRYLSIAKEASEQSHRSVIPDIKGIIFLKDIDKYMLKNNLFAYERLAGSTISLSNALIDKGSYSIIVGPEGGYDDSEVSILLEKGFTPISLGKRILRVETAAIYALSVISYALEK